MTTTTEVIEFSDNAMVVACQRYFAKGPDYPECERCHVHHESMEQFTERVSLGNAEYRRTLIAPLRFLPNSPTLFNVGLGRGTLSACFKLNIADTMFDSPMSIMNTVTKAAKLLKDGGGVGYVFSALRQRGAVVNSTHGKALGPVGVAYMLHAMAKQITQGGKREAAQMGILSCDHPDAEDFIHWKDVDPDGLSTFNISLGITDEFMREAILNASSRPGKMLRSMAESAWKTGDPGVFFMDTSNAGYANPTPWLGLLDGTNPCGEVPLLPDEPCNLGSPNIARILLNAEPYIVSRHDYDWAALDEITRLGIRYLDDVLDLNHFPDPAIEAASLLTRKLGYGACGFADLLAVSDIPYGSQEAVDLGGEIMARINRVALDESIKLGVERGPAPAFLMPEAAPYLSAMPWSTPPRNATRTCIAPTGTIAVLMDASSGIEPYFAREWTRKTFEGFMLPERPWPLRSAHGAGETVAAHRWDSVQTAHEVEAGWHIKHLAAWQAHTDLAVSKTINMPNSATADDIYNAYVQMWELKCKGGTVYRDGSRSGQVLVSTDHAPEPLAESVTTSTANLVKMFSRSDYRDQLPDDRPSVRGHKFTIDGMKGYLHIGEFADGTPGEVFIKLSRGGSTLDGFADWWANTFSVALQIAHRHGIPFTVFTDHYKGTKFDPSGRTEYPSIGMTSSLADYIARFLELHYGDGFPKYAPPVTMNVTLKAEDLASPKLAEAVAMTEMVGAHTGAVCPDCSAMLIYAEGCYRCPSCGYNRCGG